MTTKIEALRAKSAVQQTAERMLGMRLGAGLTRAGDDDWAVVLFLPRPLPEATERKIVAEFPEMQIKFRRDPRAVLHGS
ncbi:hypothetical protein U91I_00467 [alpha proteobacterium U9-1i]|nr:hypothetical protein U91I_00467 [alpha proteobacterium U9-1i]